MSTQQPQLTPAYLRTLPSVRQRSTLVYRLAQQDKLSSFNLDEGKYDDVVDYCIEVIKRTYPTLEGIPGHSRWRHFETPEVGGLLEPIVKRWEEEEGVDERERVRRLVDLFVVSVLLDAGAGPTWTYTYHPTSEKIGRSEGLAIASLDMFTSGLFSSDPKGCPCRVDHVGLGKLTMEDVKRGLQVDEGNQMEGLEGRSGLLLRLGEVLQSSETFGKGQGVRRPGNMLDKLVPQGSGENKFKVDALWTVVMDDLGKVWPGTRTKLDGVGLGDAWVCEVLKKEEKGDAAGIVPFHKLSQWLTYSLMEPFQKVLGCEIEGVEQMTGLPEYRNGGLLVDLGLLTLKPHLTPSDYIPRFAVDSQAVIEWRCITVIALDNIAERIKEKLGKPDMTTAQILEAATWKAGRLIAKEKRRGGGPPIEIISDGTVF